MFKKVLTYLIAAAVIFQTAPAALASETEYVPTSSLNGGWQVPEITSELVAWAELGQEMKSEGMRIEVGDDTSAISVSSTLGKEGWVLSPNKGNSARYLNIDINNDIAYDVTDGQSYAVEVDYYDEGISSLAMEYDAMDYQPLYQKESGSPTSQPALNDETKISEGEYLVFKNSRVWRTYSWFLPNPKFTDKLSGYDLRIGIYGETMGFSRGGDVVISAVRIYKLSTKSRIEITGDTSERMGNIFFDGEEIEIKTDFSSCIYPHHTPDDGAYQLDVRYTARDEDGKVVWQGNDAFTLEPLSTASRTMKFRVDKFGIYRLDVEAFCNDKKIYSFFGTEFSYVHSDKGKTVNPKCGIMIGLTNTLDTKIAQLARNVGIPNVRMMCYYYNFRKGATNYEITNTAVPEGFKSLFRAFKKAGLEIDANFHSASWMGSAYNFSEIERTPPYTEDGLRRWAEYCSMMAELLGDTVDQIEIWNEYNLGPNHSFNMENRPASDYGKMYEVSKKAIKSVNPDIPVIGLNTSGAPVSWIEEVLASGVTDMDILAIHPYLWYGDPLTYNIAETRIKPVVELFNKYGMQDIPLWVTECGYSSHYENVNTDLEQGLYDVQAYTTVMATEEIDRYYIYCLLDKSNNLRADRETNFGLMRAGINNPIPYMTPYAAKPGYLMVSHMNMMYYDAEFEEQINLGKTGVIIRNRHKTDGKQFAVMFSNKENGELVTLNLGVDKITLYDAYGNATEVYGKNGIFSFDLSKRLIYIEGDFKSFDRVVGGVFPGKTEITKLYGTKAEIPIVNYTGHTVYAKAEPLEGSDLEGAEAVIGENGGSLYLNGGNALDGTERVRLTLYDDDKTYFCGYVYVKYMENVHMLTTLIPTSEGWQMRCTLTNLSDTEAVSGRMTLLTPFEWKKSVPDTYVELKPSETRNIDLTLPVAPVADERTIEMAFVTDEETMVGSYVSKLYNFSAAQKATQPVIIDADGSEWTEGFMTLNRSDQFQSLISLGNPYSGPDDLSVKAAVKWDDDNFYFYADVLDNVHFSKGVTPVNIWQMDSIQIALVYDPESQLQRTEFEEFAISDLDGTPTIYRHKTRFKGDGDYTKIDGSELAIKNDGLHTYYELKIPWDSLMVERVKIEPGTELKFAMVVNENDGVGRVGYMAFGDGIVSSKNSSLFKQLYIRGDK